MAPDTLAFGPFRLDRRSHRLYRDGEPVDLSAHLVDLLLVLTLRPGELLTKQALFDAAWPGVFVTDNALARAVADLRRALGDDARQPRYIQTVAGRGYRFVASVDAGVNPSGGGPARASVFEQLREFVASVATLEHLRIDTLPETRARLEQAAAALPDYAPVHVALASAWALTGEASRSQLRPDRHASAQAVRCARRACEVDPSMAEAWGTLAFALTGAGESSEARAAARHAVRLEPAGWRHHFRLALAAWGEERLRAAGHARRLLPGFPYACFLGATVLVARGLLGPARDLVLECTTPAHDALPDERLPAAGVHWLVGAIASVDLARADEALAAFAREVDAHRAERLYSTEFVVNALHWRAALRVRLGQTAAAIDDLRAVLRLTPDHARSLVAIVQLLDRLGRGDEARALRERVATVLQALVEGGRGTEAALCRASRAAMANDVETAMTALSTIFDEGAPDHAGWTLPIEPWLGPLMGTPGFEALLVRLARRAA